MSTYGLLRLTSFLSLVVLALCLASWGMHKPNWRPWESVSNWIFRIALFGWLGSEALEIILFPREWGTAMRGFIDSVYGR
jgi:hypothetical protein